MNGPNPVCTSATQNANQSRPRWLRREAATGGSGGSGRGGGGGASSCSTARLGWRGWGDGGVPVRWAGLPLRYCCLARWRDLPRARGTDHHDRLTALIFGRESHLVTGQVHGNRSGLTGRGEVQGAPVDGDLARADTEKATEVDDRRTHLTVAADDDVHDPPHVLSGVAAHAFAEDCRDLLVVEHDRGRTGRGIWGRGGGRWCSRRRRILRR